MRNLYLLLLLASTLCSRSFCTTASAQAASANIYLTAAKAQQIADSLTALPDCRDEAKKWHIIADSTRAQSLRYKRASELNLDAKRAAESSEGFQRNITASRTVQLEEFKSKAHRRGFVVAVLVVVDVLVAYLVITH